MLKVGSNEVYE